MVKKDYSQSFAALPAHVWAVVQDQATGKFALLRSREEWEEDACDVFTPELDDDRPMMEQIASYVNGIGFGMVSLRELARQTETSYSGADGSPAGLVDSVCVLAVVDRTGRERKIIEGQKVEWVNIGKLISDLQVSLYLVPVVELGLAQLQHENRVDNYRKQ